VRTILGTTPRILAQRGIRLDRLAVLTLRQDAYAEEPGPTVTLSLGERTHYRAAATVLDAFERENGALGDGYEAWTPAGFGALTIASETVTAAAVASAGGLAVYTAETLSVDQWAEATLAALRATGGTLARVGVGVRHDATTGTGYLAFAERTAGGAMTTRLSRYNAASATILATATTPWDPGEVLRLEAEWATLRVYRQGVLILEHVDTAPLLVTGSPALHVTRAHANDLAALDAFVAGPLRLEYVGAVADLGDVTASLGYLEPTASPATWTMTVVNVAPMGGAARLSELIRHGTNDGPNTYEIHRAPARVVHTIRGGSASFQIAEGRVDHPEALTESTVRLACAGHDAFLTPNIQTAVVTPIPGPNPVLVAAPVPEDPCGADAPPTVVPGSPPTEPPPVPAIEPGPEAPRDPDRQPPPPEPPEVDANAQYKITLTRDFIAAEDFGAFSPISDPGFHQLMGGSRGAGHPVADPPDQGASYTLVYRSLVLSPGTTLHFDGITGRHENRTLAPSAVVSTTSITWEIVQYQEPASVDELLAFTFSDPPSILTTLEVGMIENPPSAVPNVSVEIPSTARFFGVRIANVETAVGDPGVNLSTVETLVGDVGFDFL
jgi:hypothetical protein